MAIYLASIAVVSVLCGLLLDAVYVSLGLSAVATIGRGSESLPHWLTNGATILLLLLSLRPLQRVYTHKFASCHS